LEKRELGSTVIFDLNKMKNTPFLKYANQILNIRKEEFESSKIIRFHEEEDILYDISEIIKTYYGKKFINILKIDMREPLKSEKFKKFTDFSSNLKLKLNIIKSDQN
jgi:hypothetical protein